MGEITKKITPENCAHESFKSDVKIGRITKEEGGPVSRYVFDCRVHCTQCGMPFEFIGIPAGVNFEYPTVSVDFLELRAPIRPATGILATQVSYQTKDNPKTETPN